MNQTCFRVHAQRKPVGRRGAAAVEFALLLPILFLVAMGAIDVGQSVNVSQIVNEASREGARFAARASTSTEGEVSTKVQEYLAEAFPAVSASALNSGTSVTVLDCYGGGPIGGDLSEIESGSSLSVQVVLDYDVVRWTAAIFGESTISIETTTHMRRE